MKFRERRKPYRIPENKNTTNTKGGPGDRKGTHGASVRGKRRKKLAHLARR